ncbi:type IV toxin-antitoxin system AbiEi family antitoxin domain-containing protein [Nocardioides houyundeii]|uniref:type IV toxin-antitoxin system AbiEi family antitoxin domain-containing protein n=1 Tax=Nocardioides houyundeii TaxID=2045452 RepID=UPI000DF46380|nr:type IV toxin-antitoxin system AbiEi family antitoxin domain-containing protein [Nocardioides houyundeii]
MDLSPVAHHLALQSGVVTRAQLLRTGLAPHDVRRLLRRRELVRLHPGVFVDHTGEPTWLQLAWGGVLLHWPAALSHTSALRGTDGPGRRSEDGAPIHLAVDRQRGLTAAPGIRLHRTVGLDGKVLWNATPPRVRIEEALIDVAAEASHDFAAISVLADAVQARRTTAARLVVALDGRARLARRQFLRAVLLDIDQGAGSVLEHGYLVRVERPHALPRARRQASAVGSIYRDVVYEQVGQIVELDGRLFHDSAQRRNHDLDRDLDAAVARLGTVRIGWGQVFGTPCRTADRIGRLLRARGWDGRYRSCAECAD